MGVVLIAAIPAIMLAPKGWQTSSTLATVVVSSLLLIVTDARDVVGRQLSKPAALAIGVRSYSLYLWHWPVIVLARWTIGLSALTMLPVLGLILVLTLISFRVENFSLSEISGFAAIPSHPILVYPVAAVATAWLGFMLQGRWKWSL